MRPDVALIKANRARWIQFASAVILVLATGGCQTPQEDETPLYAKIVRMKGVARGSMDGGKTWSPVTPGAVFKQGAVIQTGRNTRIEVVLSDRRRPACRKIRVLQLPHEAVPIRVENTLLLGSDSSVTLDKLEKQGSGPGAARDLQFSLPRGRMLGQTETLTEASKYEVRLGNGIARVMPKTIYSISAEGVLLVYVGRLAVTTLPGDRQVVVTVGSMMDTRTGQIGPIPPCK